MMDDRTVLRLLHFCFMLFYVLFAGLRYTVAVAVACTRHNETRNQENRLLFSAVVLVEIVGYSKFCIWLRYKICDVA